jgi:hypothetical protein
MTRDAVSTEPCSLYRLRVTAEPDPQALARVLERFQNLNILPRRVVACFPDSQPILHIQVDVAGLTEERLSLIAAKVREATCVLESSWDRV